MPEKDESHEASGRGRGVEFVAVLAVLLPLLYCLSIGPVFLVLEKTNYFSHTVSHSSVLNFYWPLVWLHEQTFMRHPLDLYVGFWGVK
jgi:hypothetical protein